MNSLLSLLYFRIPQNTCYPPPKFCMNDCFQKLLGWSGGGGGCMFLRTFANNREIQNHVYGNLYRVMKLFPLLDVYSSFYLQNISHFTPVSSIRISLPFFYLLISYLRNDACPSLNLSNNPKQSLMGGGGGKQTECIMGDSIIVNALLYNTNKLLHFRS